MRYPTLAPRPRPPARGLRLSGPLAVILVALVAVILFADLGLFALGCATAPEDRAEMAAYDPSPVPPGHRQAVRPLAWEEAAAAGLDTRSSSSSGESPVAGGQGEAPDAYVGKIVLSERIDGVHFHLSMEDAPPGRYALDLYRDWTCETIERERAALPPATERVATFVVDEEGRGEAEGVIAWDAGEVPFVSLASADVAPSASALAQAPPASGEPPTRGVVPSALLIVQETLLPEDEEESPFVATAELPLGTGCVDLDL